MNTNSHSVSKLGVW